MNPTYPKQEIESYTDKFKIYNSFSQTHRYKATEPEEIASFLVHSKNEQLRTSKQTKKILIKREKLQENI